MAASHSAVVSLGRALTEPGTERRRRPPWWLGLGVATLFGCALGGLGSMLVSPGGSLLWPTLVVLGAGSAVAFVALSGLHAARWRGSPALKSFVAATLVVTVLAAVWTFDFALPVAMERDAAGNASGAGRVAAPQSRGWHARGSRGPPVQGNIDGERRSAGRSVQRMRHVHRDGTLRHLQRAEARSQPGASATATSAPAPFPTSACATWPASGGCTWGMPAASGTARSGITSSGAAERPCPPRRRSGTSAHPIDRAAVASPFVRGRSRAGGGAPRPRRRARARGARPRARGARPIPAPVWSTPSR